MRGAYSKSNTIIGVQLETEYERVKGSPSEWTQVSSPLPLFHELALQASRAKPQQTKLSEKHLSGPSQQIGEHVSIVKSGPYYKQRRLPTDQNQCHTINRYTQYYNEFIRTVHFTSTFLLPSVKRQDSVVRGSIRPQTRTQPVY